MKKQFVSYPIALALYELGFDGECHAFYCENEATGEIKLAICSQLDSYCMNTCKNSIPIKSSYGLGVLKTVSVPIWQQVIDWFRETQEILVNPTVCYNGVYHWVVAQVIDDIHVESINIAENDWYKAREAAILQAIEIIKNK